MPLVGGGGAGNVAGSNPVGVGTGLNYIGNHAYALSGEFVSSNSTQTMLSFSTGNTYLVGTITVNAAIKEDEAVNGQTTAYAIFFDNQQIMAIKYDSKEEDMDAQGTTPILIPPYTKVEIKSRSGATASGFLHFAQIVGEVYA
jgi:hypothetical protein